MKENKKAKKVVALLLCAVLLVVGSVTGTMAYLTSKATVTNTFTVGNVKITLDETDVDNSTPGEDDRDIENEYHLLPGATYVKDPIVHVAAGSESCWVFVKVLNGLEGIESQASGYYSIDTQIAGNGWSSYTTVGDAEVYYKYHAKSNDQTDLPVFASFTINSDISNTTLDGYKDKTIELTAYAIQSDGLDVDDAWNAVKNL